MGRLKVAGGLGKVKFFGGRGKTLFFIKIAFFLHSLENPFLAAFGQFGMGAKRGKAGRGGGKTGE